MIWPHAETPASDWLRCDTNRHYVKRPGRRTQIPCDVEHLIRPGEVEKIVDCDQRLARYRAALDAGADPAEVTQWINEAKAEQARAEGDRRALRTTRRMTREEISTVLTELGDLARVIVQADADDKAKLYRELGLRLTYRPQKQLVEATVTPGLDMCKRLVSEGGLDS